MKDSEREPNIYENKGAESPTVESAVEISEAQSVIAAENIALVRQEITQKIIHENIPAGEWTDVTEEVLKKYPQLEIYKDYFLKTVEESKKMVRLTNQLWETTVQDKTESPEDAYYKGEANKEASKTLFKAVFDKSAEGIVRAMKGRQCLVFELTKPDFNKIKTNPERKGDMGFFKKETKAHVPAIVFLSESDPYEKGIILAHENQHLQNSLLSLAKNYIALELGDSDMPKELKRAKWRNLEGVFADAQREAGNEILSYATFVELIEGTVTASHFEAEKFWDSVRWDLTQGPHYEQYKKKFNLDDYEKNVSAAIDAFIHLTEIYKKAFPDKTTRMAIDVLAQFPLSKWPGVVNLIEKRRKSPDH